MEIFCNFSEKRLYDYAKRHKWKFVFQQNNYNFLQFSTNLVI